MSITGRRRPGAFDAEVARVMESLLPLDLPAIASCSARCCARCSHHLTDSESKRRGYGPVCWSIIEQRRWAVLARMRVRPPATSGPAARVRRFRSGQ